MYVLKKCIEKVAYDESYVNMEPASGPAPAAGGIVAGAIGAGVITHGIHKIRQGIVKGMYERKLSDKDAIINKFQNSANIAAEPKVYPYKNMTSVYGGMANPVNASVAAAPKVNISEAVHMPKANMFKKVIGGFGKVFRKVASYEDIKMEAYKDELEKIALKNYVAEYGIKGSTAGAGVGAVGSMAVAHHLLRKVETKIKNPLIATAMVAGAVAGAAAGGRIGAYMGGGKKGTTNLFTEGYH